MQTTCTRCSTQLGFTAVFHVVRLRTTRERRIWFCCPLCLARWLQDDQPDAQASQFRLFFPPSPLARW
jgi:hypothetical protein